MKKEEPMRKSRFALRNSGGLPTALSRPYLLLFSFLVEQQHQNGSQTNSGGPDHLVSAVNRPLTILHNNAKVVEACGVESGNNSADDTVSGITESCWRSCNLLAVGRCRSIFEGDLACTTLRIDQTPERR